MEMNAFWLMKIIIIGSNIETRAEQNESNRDALNVCEGI